MSKMEMSKNKQLVVNLVSSIVVFAANLIIGFFLSPYIVERLGVEANGFVSLANNYIMYASLVTIALNSMAGRFMTIAIHQDNYEQANKYYNGVFAGNLVITLLLFLPAVFLIAKLETVINIPKDLVFDIKVLFSFIFANFFLITAVPNWHIATFVRNKLYLESLRTIEGNLIRVGTILLLFILFSPHVYYIGIATFLSAVYTTICAFFYHKMLLPELKINRKYIEFKPILELISSGIWNTINHAGQLLLNGLDLLITNLFVGAAEMGALALAKTVPNIIGSLAGTLTGVFSPSLTIDYAKGDKEALKANLKQGMKLTGTLLTIPLAILIIFGSEFYSLWVPSQDAKVLQILSILTCFGLVFTSGIQCLYNVFTVVNKMKLNSILILLVGVINAGVVFVLLKTTNLGVYAIAGVSTFICLVRNFVYTVPFAAKYLGLKWNAFFPEVIRSVVSVVILTIVGYFVKSFFVIDSWTMLVLASGITGVIGLIINMIIVLNKEERKYLLNIVLSRFKKRETV